MAILLLAIAGCHQPKKPALDLSPQRKQMVAEQLRSRGISDRRVLAAMSKVPREQFVPEKSRSESYADRPLPIGNGQTISQPYMVALMTEQLRLQPQDRVLEIGTGSGYQTAVLAELAANVYSVEIVEPLAKQAKATLRRLGYRNVQVKVGDGYQGWAEYAPYDAIVVTCAPDHVPQPLTQQLKEGGRMTIPVGPRLAQELYLLMKRNGRMQQAAIVDVRFVPMTRPRNRNQ